MKGWGGPRRVGVLPRAPLWRVALAATRWLLAGLLFAAWLISDRLRGKRGKEQVGVRLRMLFERIGGTAIKLAQQLSIRVDVLPKEICDQLAMLADRVAPIPAALVLPFLEQGLGRPVAEVFSRLEPEAIGSGSVACVYRAQLHTGERVAVKLLRPGVIARFAADLAVLDLVLWLAEALTFARAGMFNHLRIDLRIMLGEETSFHIEARFQRMFARALRKAKMPWIEVPKVHSQLCSDTVLVTDFVDATPVNALLLAREEAPWKIPGFEAKGIDLAVVSDRLVRFAFWARFETLFFHADPHPGNVFILPGNRIVLIDFGGCGSTSRSTRRLHLEAVRQVARADASAISQVMMADLSPLPHLDEDRFRKEIEQRFSTLLIAIEDPASHWSERMAASAWLRLLEVTRQYQVRINLDTVRSIRAFLLYDTLAFRLNPLMGVDVIERYLREVNRRRERRFRKRPPIRIPTSPLELAGSVASALTRGEELLSVLMPQLDSGRVAYEAVVRQAALAAREGLQVLLGGVLLVIAANVARLAAIPTEISRNVAWVALVAGALVAARFARRSLFLLRRVQRKT